VKKASAQMSRFSTYKVTPGRMTKPRCSSISGARGTSSAKRFFAFPCASAPALRPHARTVLRVYSRGDVCLQRGFLWGLSHSFVVRVCCRSGEVCTGNRIRVQRLRGGGVHSGARLHLGDARHVRPGVKASQDLSSEVSVDEPCMPVFAR